MSSKKTSEAKQQAKGGNEEQYSNQSRTNGIAIEETEKHPLILTEIAINILI